MLYQLSYTPKYPDNEQRAGELPARRRVRLIAARARDVAAAGRGGKTGCAGVRGVLSAAMPALPAAAIVPLLLGALVSVVAIVGSAVVVIVVLRGRRPAEVEPRSADRSGALAVPIVMEDPKRPPGESQYEQERPNGPGRPPRPATEPPGAEGSTKTSKTETDPATGEPQR